MKNRFSFLFIFFLLVFAITLPSYSAPLGKFSIYLDSRLIGKVDIFSGDGNEILLPLRSFFRALGGSVGWIGSSKETYIQFAGKKIKIKIGGRSFDVNGETGSLSIPLSAIDGKLVISSEIISKAWGYSYKVNTSAHKIFISTTLPVLEKFSYKNYSNKIKFIFSFSKKPKFKIGILAAPSRIFIDFYNTSSRISFDSISLTSNNIIRGIRSGKFSHDTFRIVFDLFNKTNYLVSESDDNITITIFKPTEQIVSTPTPIPTSTPSETYTPIPIPTKKGKWIIILDPGHGGKDPGAIGKYGTREKNIVLSVALKLKTALEKSGFMVYLTRSSDIFIPLQQRPRFANAKNGDLFISIHVNSAPKNTKASGIETFYLSSKYSDPAARDVAKRENVSSFEGKPLSEKELIGLILSDLLLTVNIEDSSKFAGFVEKALTRYTKLPVRGVKTAPFIVLKGLKMPAVLIELGFVSNPIQEKLLKTADFQNKVVRAVTSAVKFFFKSH